MWARLAEVSGANFPYKLHLQGDRNVVFYDSFGNVLKATDTHGGVNLGAAFYNDDAPYYLLPG